MEECKEQILKVEDQIDKASQQIYELYSLEETDKDKFESKSVQDRLYDLRKEKEDLRKEKEDLRKKEEDLRKEKEDLRKEKLLLLEISLRTSAPTGNSITLPLSCPFLPSPFLLIINLRQIYL